MVNFIGIGAQKSGTSWIYACLFEHPEVCIPVKEIHFFSRPRFEHGAQWYESHFKRCGKDEKQGEFSTSYLYSDVAAKRIVALYPKVKTIAVLREPASRAYSQYGNAIKAGEISRETSFEMYIQVASDCIAQGLYSIQLQRYYDVFHRSQVLVLVYEDIVKNPKRFIQNIYRHIGVDDTFVPPSLEARINVARTPKSVRIDSAMHAVAEFLRRYGAGKLVHAIKSSGVTDAVRAVNTESKKEEVLDVSQYKKYFKDDVQALSNLIERDLVTQWKYNET